MKTNKPLTDVVADYIAKNTALVDLPEGMSRDELRYQTKEAAKCPHPQKTIKIGLTINVGDMFRPTDVCVTSATGRPMILTPQHRFIILQLSHPQQDFSLINDYHTDMETTTVSSVVVMCKAVPNQTIQPQHILLVLMMRRHDALIDILRMCKLVGNVAHLF